MPNAQKIKEYMYGFKVLKDLGNHPISKVRMILVECKVCGKDYKLDIQFLKRRKNCGCMRNGKWVSSYAKEYPRLVKIYGLMKYRCYNKGYKRYAIWGGRGIKICEEWLSHPDNFCMWSLKNGYDNNLTIDRIDNNGHYEPNNCRWTDIKTQTRNTSRIKLNMELAEKIREDKSFMSIKDLSIKYNVNSGTIWLVVNNRTWT